MPVFAGLSRDDADSGLRTAYTKEDGELICDLVTAGLSLEHACRRLGIRFANAMHWQRRYPDFREAYLQAIEDRGVVTGERVLDLADDAMGMSGDVLKAQEMKVRAAQWYAERVAPKRFGSKSQVDLNVGVRALSDEELAQRIASVRAEQATLIGSSVATSATSATQQTQQTEKAA